MRVEVTSIGGGGRGVAKSAGKTWFVAGALPGETVDAEPERERAGIVEARLVRVSAHSAWRDHQPCPVAGACGGCDLAHVRREAAAEVLRAVACGALRHSDPVLADAVRRAPVRVSPMGWRLRARLHFDAASRTVGFLGPRSHNVVGIEPCRVVSPLLLRSLPGLAVALRETGLPDGELEWLEDLDGTLAVAGWYGTSAPRRPVGELAGFHPLARHGGIRAGGWGADGVTMALPVPLWVPLGAFFQGNRHLVRPLFETVGDLVRREGPARVVDLYGGVGFLAAAASRAFTGALTVVELDALAATAARRNLPGAAVVAAAAEAFLSSTGPARGTLAIVDAPRTGLSRAAASRLAAWGPDAIVLLACDAARFGRDAGRFLGDGYALNFLELWDLFGGSHHVEVVASFRRAVR